MRIANLMNATVLTVGPGESFENLLCKLSCLPARIICVVDEAGKLLGVLSSYDLLNRMVPFYIDANLAKALAEDESVMTRRLEENRQLTARDIMTPVVAKLSPDDLIIEAEALIRDQGVNVMPVVDAEGRVVGEVTRKDILRYITLSCCRCSCDSVLRENTK